MHSIKNSDTLVIVTCRVKIELAWVEFRLKTGISSLRRDSVFLMSRGRRFLRWDGQVGRIMTRDGYELFLSVGSRAVCLNPSE
ncbi:hypothetical protein [Pasteuria penetrans]|uniref:hypothetical protein n=1 Tax=Pasteuria penetrans TaxID=86005 RepID=UPI000FA07956|nr:hypothetical protein [Pasteuria penetrans]